MKLYNSFYAMAAFAAIGLMSSCSSDDEIAAIDDNGVVTNKTITASFNIGDDNDENATRLGANIMRGSSKTTFKPQIYSDDYFWIYAPDVEGGWFNKIAPGETGSSTVKYASVEGCTVKFVGSKLVYAFYSAMSDVKAQDAHALDASKFASKDASGNTILTLTRNTDAKYDYNLAYVYGEANDEIHYTDTNNPFSFRVASAMISNDGYLVHYENDGKGKLTVNDQHGSVNVVSYAPKIRFSMPAAVTADYETDASKSKNFTYTKDQFNTYFTNRSSEVSKYLSQLEYKIVVDAVPTSESGDTGYPNGMTYRLLDKTNDANILAEQRVIVPNGVTFGKELKLYYGPSTSVTSTNLWNTTEPTLQESKNKLSKVTVADDYCTGDVYVSLPPVAYKRIRVLVNVSYNGNDNTIKEAVKDLCHTYKMDITETDKINFSFTADMKADAIKDITSVVYDLGSIWGDRSTFIGASKAPAMSAPAKAKANGWEIVDDAEFDF